MSTYKPYERRIDKFTKVNGKTYFKIAHLFMGDWIYFRSSRYPTFAAAAVAVRHSDLNEISKIETVRQF